jgi:polyisoprenoid-binding protein YceI
MEEGQIMRARCAVSSGLLLLVASVGVGAEPVELELDAAASTAAFTLGATLHTVHGEMPITAGRLRFDPDGGEASGEVVLDARGAVTGDDKRDEKMHDEVLRSGEFPRLVFRLERVEGALPADGSGELRLVGSLELLGEAHDVVIPASVSRHGDTVEGHAEVSVPYVAWGLEDPSVFVLRVDKEILVELDVRGTLGR